MSTAQAIVRQDGEGEQLWFAGGGVFTMKASSEETGGAFVLFEDRVVRGKTTPMHLHPNEDETIYVLEGELLVDMDGEQRRVGRHGVFVAPRGLPHAFLVTSETARLLCVQTPGSGESFYRGASEPLSAAYNAATAAGPGEAARRSRALRDDPASRTATVHGGPIRARPDTRLTPDNAAAQIAPRARSDPAQVEAGTTLNGARRASRRSVSTDALSVHLVVVPGMPGLGRDRDDGPPFCHQGLGVLLRIGRA